MKQYLFFNSYFSALKVFLFMKILKYIFWFFWKLWFYLLVLFVIIILSPLLIITLSNVKWYKYFFVLARFWATLVFYGIGFRKQVKLLQLFNKNESYMLVANHSSMMDIMLMLIMVKKNPFVFVGKKELAKVPIFGYFYKKASILVDRSSVKSRQETILRAQEKLRAGLSICIFPEGGVSDDESVVLDSFKDGAFRLAIEFQIPIVPVTFVGLKKHFPFRFFAGKPGSILVYVHPFVDTKGLTQEDKLVLKEKVRNIILDPLLK